MIKKLVLLGATALFLSACGDGRPAYTEADREKSCYPLQFGTEGQIVTIKLSGQQGMVVEPQYFINRPASAWSLDELCDRSKKVGVRVNLHGIALDKGILWDGAMPEVLPIIRFYDFEIESWTAE